jgi:hypothetical protein
MASTITHAGYRGRSSRFKFSVCLPSPKQIRLGRTGLRNNYNKLGTLWDHNLFYGSLLARAWRFLFIILCHTFPVKCDLNLIFRSVCAFFRCWRSKYCCSSNLVCDVSHRYWQSAASGVFTYVCLCVRVNEEGFNVAWEFNFSWLVICR